MDPDPSLHAFAREVDRPEDGIDLARAALVMARLEYPDLDVKRHLHRLEALAADAPAAARRGDDLQRLHRLREYLFEDLGFAGNRDDYYDVRNSFLSDVLERRLGIPITLTLVLVEAGRRVGLPLAGIGLPGHFIAGAWLSDSPILLDPFDRGTILTPDGCADLVERAVGKRVALSEGTFRPVTKRQFLARMLNNLKGIYWRREQWRQAVAVIDRILVLDPDAGSERRDRGMALAQLGDLGGGLADWERYLTQFPNAPDGEKVRGHLRRVRQKLAERN
jgi:regulator of sirC expression with transglutaminase-like and TPR domain